MNTTMKKFLLAGGVATLVALVPSEALFAQTIGQAAGTVTITNSRAVPVTVYLDREPVDVRLGSVAPHARQILALPAMKEGSEVRIFVDPQGGAELSTPDLMVQRGASLKVRVPNNDVGYLPPSPSETIPNPGVKTATVTVENQRQDGVTLYVERGDIDTAVGTIPAGAERTLELPAWLASEDRAVELLLHPQHGLDLESQTIQLDPKTHLLIKLPSRAAKRG